MRTIGTKKLIGATVLGVALLAIGSLQVVHAMQDASATGLAGTIPSRDVLRDRWGIEVASLRTTAGGYMVDFRYNVVDAEKAAPLFKRQTKPYLVDVASKAMMRVHEGGKVGSLRSTNPPVAGRTYFMVFANPGQRVRSHGAVKIVVGDLQIDGLTVE